MIDATADKEAYWTHAKKTYTLCFVLGLSTIFACHGPDIPTTYADLWIPVFAGGTGEFFGIGEQRYKLTVWVQANRSHVEFNESGGVRTIPVVITNSGSDPLGSDTREWKLLLRSCCELDEFSVKNLIVPQQTEKTAVANNEEDETLEVRLPVLYPGESIRMMVTLKESSNDEANITALVVDPLDAFAIVPDFPVKTKMRVTRYSPDPGPPSKTGNKTFVFFLVLFGVWYFWKGLSRWIKMSRDLPLDLKGTAIVCIGILTLVILHAVAATRMVLVAVALVS